MGLEKGEDVFTSSNPHEIGEIYCPIWQRKIISRVVYIDHNHTPIIKPDLVKPEMVEEVLGPSLEDLEEGGGAEEDSMVAREDDVEDMYA